MGLLKCKNCRYKGCALCGTDHIIHAATCENYTPATHADCFRLMTDDELAENIGESIDCEVCKTMHHSESGECPCKPHQSCVDFWLDWLKQKANDAD